MTENTTGRNDADVNRPEGPERHFLNSRPNAFF
jgi:hypothetical protein